MKCLYSTTTEYNYTEFKRYNWAMFLARCKLLPYILMEIALIAAALIFRRLEILVLIAFAFPVIVVGTYIYRVRKAYKNGGAPKKMTVTYEFYETELVERLDKGSAHYPYEKLQSLVETKKNVYLLLPGNVSIVLVKANFPAGLGEFVRTIIPNAEEMNKLKK